MKHSAAIFIVLALTSSAFADFLVSENDTGDVRLTVRLDRKTTQIVEPIRLTLIVTASRGSMVTFPTLQQKLGPFQVRSIETRADVPASPPANERQWIATISLETLQTGTQTIPPLEVQYRTPAGSNDSDTLKNSRTLNESDKLISEPIDIRVVSLLENRADLTDFRDIKPVVEFKVSDQPSRVWMWWTAAAVALTALLIAGVLLVLKKRRVLTPAEWARSQIAQLESQIDQLGPDAVYDQLALIVNEFLGWEFGTTGPSSYGWIDVVSADQTLPSSVTERLSEFKSMSDEVRFARLSPSADQIRSAINQIRALVQACDETGMTTPAEAA